MNFKANTQEELKRLISENKVIPFVGAGVSKDVKDKDGKFKPVQGDNPSDLQEGVVKDFGEFIDE